MSDQLSPSLASRLIELVTAGGVGAALTGFISWFVNRKRQAADIHLTNEQAGKAKAEREASTVDTALKLAHVLSEQVEGLRAENESLRQQVALLRDMKKPELSEPGEG